MTSFRGGLSTRTFPHSLETLYYSEKTYTEVMSALIRTVLPESYHICASYVVSFKWLDWVVIKNACGAFQRGRTILPPSQCVSNSFSPQPYLLLEWSLFFILALSLIPGTT